MELKEKIRLTYEGLRDRETLAGELCPACKGGSSNEKTFSVSRREGRLLYICHRASCGVRGSTGSAGPSFSGGTKQVSTRGAVGRWAFREAASVTGSVKKILYDKYEITESQISRCKIGIDELTERLVLPVLSFRGDVEGATLRSLKVGEKPKSLTHTEPGAMAWYLNHNSDTLIIVEDQFSAIRASEYMNAVALLGVNLNDERADAIKKAGFKRVFIALDYDAFGVSLELSIKYRSYLNLIPLRLEKDIKDMSRQELEQWLESNNLMEVEV